MADHEVDRRLAAILAADVAGYTRLMEEDTDGTVAAWKAARDGALVQAYGRRRVLLPTAGRPPHGCLPFPNGYAGLIRNP
jgi:hypothetical protein